MITIFTPTYNRAHTLSRLYHSLRRQDCHDFEWLVINDGSTDHTNQLFQQWMSESNYFPIRYHVVENGGKQRAINKALQWAKGEYFFIVDSDDFLMPDAITFIKDAFSTLTDDSSYIGISGIRGGLDGKPLHRIPLIDAATGYCDATNLERAKWNLQADMAEVFFTEKLQKYVFPVWKGEKFTPEAVIWDKIALDGYKLRWFDKVTYLCDYQPDGLTNSSWKLLKENPMGYAMLFNTQLRVNKYRKAKRDSLIQGTSWIVNTVIQFISCCCLAGEYRYIKKCESLYVWLLFVPGFLVSLRRRWQFFQYLK